MGGDELIGAISGLGLCYRCAIDGSLKLDVSDEL